MKKKLFSFVIFIFIMLMLSSCTKQTLIEVSGGEYVNYILRDDVSGVYITIPVFLNQKVNHIELECLSGVGIEKLKYDIEPYEDDYFPKKNHESGRYEYYFFIYIKEVFPIIDSIIVDEVVLNVDGKKQTMNINNLEIKTFAESDSEIIMLGEPSQLPRVIGQEHPLVWEFEAKEDIEIQSVNAVTNLKISYLSIGENEYTDFDALSYTLKKGETVKLYLGLEYDEQSNRHQMFKGNISIKYKKVQNEEIIVTLFSYLDNNWLFPEGEVKNEKEKNNIFYSFES